MRAAYTRMTRLRSESGEQSQSDGEQRLPEVAFDASASDTLAS
jgi:hypothetical protein